jgi:nitrite reductase/ring-hydroxylating ferredoxin subunit
MRVLDGDGREVHSAAKGTLRNSFAAIDTAKIRGESVMKPEAFTRVAYLSELNGRGPFALSTDGVDIVLLRTLDGWRAFEGHCPHQGALLGEGEIEGDALVCRNHRWRFSVDSGQREGGPECLACCPVAERDGSVFVDMTGLRRSFVPKTTTRSLDDLPGPKGLPLVGNMHQLSPTKVHLIFEDWAARFGSIYQFRMGSTRVVVTTDPALIVDVLRARPDTLRRDANMDVILRRWVSGGYLTRRVTRGVRSASSRWRPSHSETYVRCTQASGRSPSA